MPRNKVPLTVRFGPYEADFDQGILRKGGRRIEIQAKPLALLELLTRKSGEIVSREELRQGLWTDDVFVDFDKNLATAINKLRNIFGDSAASPRFIETVPRRGYRFLATVEVVSPLAKAPDAAPVLATDRKPQRVSPFVKNRIFWTGVCVGAIAEMTLLLLSGFWQGRPVDKLKRTDAVVIGDFRNSTGDPVFDYTLRQGLEAQLGQSPFLSVLSNNRIGRTLALMESSPGAFVSPSLTRQVCERTAGDAAINGSIARIGNSYVLGLEAVNCQDGDLMADEHASANSKSHVLAALDSAATKLRAALGESLKDVQKFNKPLAQVTTSSLAALKAYSLGQEVGREQGADRALTYDQRAIGIDPNFAMAWEAAGLNYSNMGEPTRAAEYLSKAFELRNRTSLRERLRISAAYYSSVTGQLQRAAETYREIIATYPRDIAAFHNLGIVLAEQGHFRQAVDATRQGIRIDPTDITLEENLAGYLLALQRFNEARQVIREEQPKIPDDYIFPAARYVLGFLHSDGKEMAEQERWFAGQAMYDDFGLELASDTAAYAGRLGSAQELTERAVESAIQGDAREAGATWQAIAAQWQAAYGFHAEARRLADEAVNLDRSSEGTDAEASLAFALAGATSQAESMAGDLAERFPVDTQIRDQWLPAIRAQIDLDRDDPKAALKALQEVSAPTEFGTDAFAADANGSCLYPSFIRGETYLALKQGAAAAADFQIILSHSGLVWNCWTGALARLDWARAQALEARTLHAAASDAARVRALDAYSEFLDAWKKANPHIPILAQAKVEYAKLH